MKQTLLLSLLVVSSCARADWINFGNTTQSLEYIDPAKISISAHGRKQFLKLSDLSEPQILPSGKAFRSAIMQHETSCEDRKLRLVSVTTYADPMGRGKVISEARFQEEEWEPTPPGSLNELLIAIVCGKQSPH